MKKLAMMTLMAVMAAGGPVMAQTAPAGAGAQNPAIVDSVPLKTRDFITEASLSSLYEIETSRVALERAQDLDVQKFAKTMIDDHTRSGEELKAAMQKSGIDEGLLATSLDSKHAERLKKLNGEKLNDFDEEYMDEQKDAHEEAVRLFKDYVSDGEDQNIKDFAAKTLPTLEAHYDHAKEIEKKVD